MTKPQRIIDDMLAAHTVQMEFIRTHALSRNLITLHLFKQHRVLRFRRRDLGLNSFWFSLVVDVRRGLAANGQQLLGQHMDQL